MAAANRQVSGIRWAPDAAQLGGGVEWVEQAGDGCLGLVASWWRWYARARAGWDDAQGTWLRFQHHDSDADRMGQLWTEEMQAELERWQASPAKAEATLTTETGSETLHVSDVLRGLVAYCVTVIRHKFLRGAPPLWSLAQSIDYAAFCRRLGEPVDPEKDLYIFESTKTYNT